MRKTIEGVEQIHRADAVAADGTVVEFQHSAISSQDITDREQFYGKMIWVLDAREAFRSGRISMNPWGDLGDGEYEWKRRKQSFDAALCPVFLDIGAVCWAGRVFWEPLQWLDDKRIGAWKDGVWRERGCWQRVQIAEGIIELQKNLGGKFRNGWGGFVTKSNLLNRLGGEAAAVAALEVKRLKHREGSSKHYLLPLSAAPKEDFLFTEDHAALQRALSFMDVEKARKEVKRGIRV